MKNRFKKMGIMAAGCVLMLLCNAVSASAAIPSDLSRNLSLRVTCAPAGDTAEGMQFRFYYVASVGADDSYTIVPPYDSTGITEDMLRYTSERAAAVQLLGRYINENGISADLEGVTAANGQAVIQGMADGIYLAASNTAYTLPDGTNYTPVPFVFRLNAALVQNAAEASTDEYTVITKFLVTNRNEGEGGNEGGENGENGGENGENGENGGASETGNGSGNGDAGIGSSSGTGTGNTGTGDGNSATGGGGSGTADGNGDAGTGGGNGGTSGNGAGSGDSGAGNGSSTGGGTSENGNGSGTGGNTSNNATGTAVRRGGTGSGTGTGGGAGTGAAGIGGTPLTSIGDEGVPTSTTSISDEGVPQSGEPSIELLDDDVPLADLPSDQDEIDALEMPDDPVPLAMLPQTGLLWWPVPILLVLGLFLAVTGWLKRRR